MSTVKEKTYDVIIFGATGFVGRQVALYFAQNAPTGVRWAIAGRSAEKLQELRTELGRPFSKLPIVVADVKDHNSLKAMVKATRVILTTVGPYDLYGEKIVEYCIASLTDYVDITGETVYVKRLIDQYHEKAKKKGVKIVPFCGFDSIPSDIGTLYTVDRIYQQFRQKTKRVDSVFKIKGGFNGGTLYSAINLVEKGQVWQALDTVLLNAEPSVADKKRSKDVILPRYNKALRRWNAPFFMSVVNSRVVRRSNSLFAEMDSGYGPRFEYTESLNVGRHLTFLISWMVSLVTISAFLLILFPPTRYFVKKVIPAPGQGPSEESMRTGFFETVLVGEGEDGRKIKVTMRDSGDPGNKVTSKMVSESALCLALQRDALPGGPKAGGVHTPATGLGLILAQRLEKAGVQFKVENL
eukprot:Colp12_sorted_trinity150504_noHs@16656